MFCCCASQTKNVLNTFVSHELSHENGPISIGIKRVHGIISFLSQLSKINRDGEATLKVCVCVCVCVCVRASVGGGGGWGES